MKKSALCTALFLSLVSIGSIGCNEYKPIDMAQVTQLEDTIPKIVPGVASIHTLQDADYTAVKIIIGDVPLYTASAEMQQGAAIRTAQALLHILGPDNNISKAKLVITKEVRKDVDNPADGISIDMKIDSLKKAAK